MLSFFQLVDAMGERTTLAVREYEASVAAAETRAMVAAAGWTQRGAPLRALRCDDGGCLREVIEEEGAIGRYLAVCERSPAACPPEAIDAATIATARLVPSAIARTLASLYGVDVPNAAQIDRATADAALLLGVAPRDDGACDVFWMRRPEPDAVKAFLLDRERGARATVLLVPTTRGLPEDWSTRWSGASATRTVEIDVLAETIVLRNGSIALVPRLRVVRAPVAAAPIPIAPPAASAAPLTKPLGRLAALPPLERWTDLHIYFVDPFTVMVRIGRTHVRRTASDFGEADASTREATIQWRALIAMCHGDGHWRWKSFGGYNAVKTMVSRLRKTLRTAFALDDDPLHPYSHEWLPRFRAHSELPTFDRDGATGGDVGGWKD